MKQQKEKKTNTKRKDCSELSNLAMKIEQTPFEVKKEFISLIDQSVDR